MGDCWSLPETMTLWLCPDPEMAVEGKNEGKGGRTSVTECGKYLSSDYYV